MEVKSYGFVLEKAEDGSFISTVILQARTVFFSRRHVIQPFLALHIFEIFKEE